MKRLLGLVMLVFVMSTEAAEAPTLEKPFYIEFANLKWEKLIPGTGPNDPDKALLHIDPKTGAPQFIVRCPKNYHVPKHWHTASESVVVITGTFTMLHKDSVKTKLTPGSFAYMPSKLVHEAWIGPEECLLHVVLDGPWDIHLVE